MSATTPSAGPLRVLVVDDEAFARQRVHRLLAQEPGVEIVEECAGGREAVEAVRRHHPDLLFLDVQMPELDGFGVLRELATNPVGTAPLVVFVTAFDEHAVRAFDVRALDYLLKPVDAERLRVALERARAQHAQASAAERHARLVGLLGRGADPQPRFGGTRREAPTPPASPGVPPPWLLVKDDGRMYLVRTAEIDWVEAYGNYAKLHVAGQTHLIRETMASLEQMLEPAGFARFHRSTIVNLHRLRDMQPWFSGDYVARLADGTRLKLSRVYRERLEQRMGRR